MAFVNRIGRTDVYFLGVRRRGLDILKGRQFERDEALGVIEELLTRRRQVDLFVAADEEGDAQFHLQVADAVGYRRLGDEELLRRFREVLYLCQGNECPECRRIHSRTSFSYNLIIEWNELK